MSASVHNTHHLHVGHLNTYFLQNKIPDLCVLLNQPTPFHVFGVTESRLNANIDNNAISIAGFSIIRRDPAFPGHTGIAVYVHSSITDITRRRHDIESEHVESVWVEVKANKSAPLLVGYIYRNPSSSFQWFDEFTAMMDKARNCSSDILLLGDFNINMFSKNPAWECTTSMFGLKQLITTATRVTSTSATLIDHIYTTNKARVVGTHVPQIGISDHFPVCCSWALKADHSIKKHQHTTIRFRSLKHFNKDSFLFDLSKVSFSTVYIHTDPDKALAEWHRLFLSVLDRHAPFREKRVKNAQLPEWLNKDIREAMSLRNELRRNKDFEAYRKQRNRVKYLVREAQKLHFQRLMDGKKDIASVWRAMNAFTRSKQTSQCIPLSANTLNEHFLSAANNLLQSTVSGNPSVSDTLVQFCNKNLNPHDSFSIPYLTVFDVGKSISSLKNKRTSGHDGISSTVLKLALPYIVDSLTYVYNLCISQGKFPCSLKKAKVVPLPKTKDLTDPNKFRPISLLSTLSKPIEKHVHSHMQKYLDKHELIHPLQSGFRPRHSCHTALTHLIDRWLTAINNRKMTGTVYLDLTKAFDLVNHDLLLQKLSVYQFSENAISFFRSYLHRRTQYVHVNGKNSSEGIVQHGVPQGSILGPLLFSIFINDLPLHISNNNVTCSLFADDGTLDFSASDVSDINQTLQVSLHEVSEWCATNHMLPNPTKTKCMLVTTRQKHQLNPSPLSLSFASQPVHQVRQQRVLGITIDDQLCWQMHIEQVCKTLSKNLFLLSRLRHFTDVPTRKLFYYAHIQPHVHYASSVWDGASENSLKRIDSLHRRAIKLIAEKSNSSTDDKFKALDILPLRKQFSLNKLVFMHKITHSKTPAYLSHLFQRSCRPYETLRNDLSVPKPRLDIFKSSLSYSGAKVWNELPSNLKSISSMKTFKAQALKLLIS